MPAYPDEVLRARAIWVAPPLASAAAIAVAVVGLSTGIEHVGRTTEFVFFLEAGLASVASLVLWIGASHWSRWAWPFALLALVASLGVAGVQSSAAPGATATNAADEAVPLSQAARKSLEADASRLRQSGHGTLASLVSSMAGAGVVGAGLIYESTSLLRAAGPAGVDAASTLLRSVLHAKVSASLTANITVDHPTFSLGGLSWRPAAAPRGASYSRVDLTRPVFSLITVRASSSGRGQHGHHAPPSATAPKTLPYSP